MSLPAVCLPALQGHVMDRRKKALTDYKKLRAFFAEEEERFLQEADKEEGSPEDEDADPAERFGSLLQAVSELERRHRNLGLSMLLQVSSPLCPDPRAGCRGSPGRRRASDQPLIWRSGDLAAPVLPSRGPQGAILILERLSNLLQGVEWM